MKNKNPDKDIIKGRWYNINKKIKKKLQRNITKLKTGKWIQKVIS